MRWPGLRRAARRLPRLDLLSLLAQGTADQEPAQTAEQDHTFNSFSEPLQLADSGTDNAYRGPQPAWSITQVGGLQQPHQQPEGQPMTTATKTPLDRLTGLETDRDRKHQKVRDIKRDSDGHEAETEISRAEYTTRGHSHPEEFDKGGRPIDGTEAAKLKAKIVKRQSEPNPYAAKLYKATQEFHQAEQLALQYRVENFNQIVEDFTPDPEDVTVRLLTAFEMLKEATEDYNHLFERVRDFALETPGINGQHITFDGRIAEWSRLAAEALANPLTRPGLDPMGDYQLKVTRDSVKVAADA